MLKRLNDLFRMAASLPVQRLAVAEAGDEAVLDAVHEAQATGLVAPILIGNEAAIREILAFRGYHEEAYQIIASESLEQSAAITVEMIRSQKADILMKGLLDTKVLLKAVVNKETGIRDAEILSHVAVFSYPDREKPLIASDCAMLIDPSVSEKAEIIRNAVSLAKTLGFTLQKVGIVSAVEKVNPKIQSTVDASELVSMYREGKFTDCIVDGPFAIDNLVSESAARHKQIESPVAGSADILVFPDLDAANVFYKTSVFLAKAEVAGLIIGAKAPIVLTSRADSSQSKLSSILLALV
jgi:phosphate butyryltransferase